MNTSESTSPAPDQPKQTEPETPTSVVDPSGVKPRSRALLIQSVLFGVVLPLAAICAKELCADAVFDPAPTVYHIALLLLVPLHHTLLIAIDPAKHRRLQLDLLGAVAIGIASVYTLLFAPILPIALLAIVVGIGLLPLAPFGALIASLLAQIQIYRNAQSSAALRWYSRPWLRNMAGICVGILSLLLAELPSLITEHGLSLATNSDAARAADGISMLRHWGDRDAMLSATDDWGRRRTQLLPKAFERKVTPAEAKQVYYRVTGESAEEVLMKDSTARERLTRWDPYRGSTRIGAVNGELELIESHLDGSFNGAAALGYAEWTMVFRNNATSEAAEARAQLRLPSGGVVSRATLWIDGEPREAAYGGRGQTRAAYQSIVRARRDPLLVSLVSPELIQIQCFPIQAGGAEMKILIGMTFPLQLDQLDRGRVTVPQLVARNFALSGSLTHRVWFESKEPIALPGVNASKNSLGAYVVDAPMLALLRGEPSAIIEVQRPEQRSAWVEDSSLSPKEQGDGHTIIEQSWEAVVPQRLSRVALVLDTSRSAEPAIAALEEALPALSRQIELRAFAATDAGYLEVPRLHDGDGPARFTRALRNVPRGGGVDNVKALLGAIAWVKEQSPNAVLWIHGPQPVPLGSFDSVRNALDRGSVRLMTLQTAPGEHVGLVELGATPGVDAMPRLGLLSDDLHHQFARWSGEESSWIANRLRRTVTELPVEPPSSAHLTRLWALDEVARTQRKTPERARELAIAHRLVTPLSSAVVLETAAQYAAANLDPSLTSTGTPSVPEPEIWAMLALALGLAFLLLRPRHQQPGFLLT
ncbi:MAG TPA: VIT domain-containing protein [Polyangiaceae bacterium]|nr:VIT domain-containing protein [Polyangiaceae bacterium]